MPAICGAGLVGTARRSCRERASSSTSPGHRTTYGAPFSDIDRLEAGDTISVELPYGSVEYRVTRHRIVDDNDLSVLESHDREELVLQACHPRFFASQRYLVYASPVSMSARS